MFIVKKCRSTGAAYGSAGTLIAHFVEKTDGCAFVLLQSSGHAQVAERMAQFFRKRNSICWCKAEARRGKLLDQFKTPTQRSFGTDSFWMGVDVPGEALSNVIITRLPFAVPDHPLIEAKLELIEERGGDPFTEFSLPEAILKLRQGVGRLIRTKSDHGIIVILDSRVLTRSYGRAFLQALPKCPVEVI
jgi:ATP-dependent DNA helicase DinG